MRDYCYHCEDHFTTHRCPGCNKPNLPFGMVFFVLTLAGCLFVANLAISPFYSNEDLPEVSQSVDGAYQVSFNTKKSTWLWFGVPLCVGVSAFVVFRLLMPPYGLYKNDTGRKRSDRYKFVVPWVSEFVACVVFAIIISYIGLATSEGFSKIIVEPDTVRLESLLSSKEVPKDEIRFISARNRKDLYGGGTFCLQIKTTSDKVYWSNPHPRKASQRKAMEGIAKNLTALCKVDRRH